MSSQIITILRKKYAVGLFWQPAAGAQNIRATALKIAKFVPGRIKYFTEYRGMVGIGSFSLGHRRRMPAAAPEIADAFSEYSAFLAVFEVPQGWYLVASRNGIIIADKLFASEIDARREYDELYLMPDWGILVAPGPWSAPRAEERPLPDIVTGDAKYGVQPVGRLGSGIISLIILAAAAAALFFIFRAPIMHAFAPKPTMSDADKIAAAEAYRKQLEARDAALVAPKPKEIVRATMPFDNLPDAGLRALQCYDAIAELMVVVPGWNAVDADCDMRQASVHLHRKYGTIPDVYDIVIARIPGAQVTENTDSDVTITIELDELPGESRLSEMGPAEVVRSVNTTFQAMRMPADVRATTETVATEKGTSVANIVLVTADSALTPIEFAKIFEEYYAVAIPRIAWRAQTRKWNYEVKIYVK